MAQETYKPVRFYEDRYHISDMGNIKNINTGTLLKPRRNPQGKLWVTLSGNGYTFGYKHGRQTRKINTKNFEIGYLVLMAFKRDAHKNERRSFHIDGNLSNNNVDNLVWD